MGEQNSEDPPIRGLLRMRPLNEAPPTRIELWFESVFPRFLGWIGLSIAGIGAVIAWGSLLAVPIIIIGALLKIGWNLF